MSLKLNSNSINYNVATVLDLTSIVNPSINDTVVVTEEGRGGVFIYRADGTSNGGTIFDSSSTGKWHRQYEGAVNVKWFGAKGDGVTDNTSTIQSVLNSFSNVFIQKETHNYRVSRLYINTGQRLDSNGAELVFTDASSCLEFDNKNNVICNNLIFNSQQGNVLLGNFKNGTYDITFNSCEFKGNSSLNSQIGLGFVNSFIISFNSCYIKNFGVNVRFGTQANRIVFNSSSIRSNQTNNHTLVRVEGGVNNSFIGCDIENCVTLFDNGSIASVEDNTSVNVTDCYLEASLNINILKYGSFVFENCYIADMRFAYYSTTDTVIFQNNVIRKVGASYFLYFMDNAPSSITIQNNYIQYDIANPTTTGIIYRGYDGGVQYVSNGNISSPTYSNATLGADVSINQTRVWDVTTSTIKHEIIESGVAYTSLGGGLTLGGGLISSGVTFQNNADYLTIKDGQWNQGHFKFQNSNVHMWIVPAGAGTSTLRIKYGTPSYNNDGVVIATF